MGVLANPKLKVNVRAVDFERLCEPNKSALDYLVEKEFFHDEKVKQLHRFFSEVGMRTFDTRNRMSFDPDNLLYTKVFYECEDGDIRWDGHLAASYVSMNWGEYNQHILGFVDQNVFAVRDQNNSVINTFLHSFCANLDSNLKRFIDPKMDCTTDYWAERFSPRPASNGYLAISRPCITMKDLHSYIGVVMPRQIVYDIFHGPLKQGRGYGILWGYLRDAIFNDYDRTTWFIDVVKNGGKGWEYRPLIYRK